MHVLMHRATPAPLHTHIQCEDIGHSLVMNKKRPQPCQMLQEREREKKKKPFSLLCHHSLKGRSRVFFQMFLLPDYLVQSSPFGNSCRFPCHSPALVYIKMDHLLRQTSKPESALSYKWLCLLIRGLSY